MTPQYPGREAMRISILCLVLAFASAIYCAATAAQPLRGEEAITFTATPNP